MADLRKHRSLKRLLRRTHVRAVISTPLTSSRGNLLGIISTHFEKPHLPDERELRLTNLLARQAVDYLERKSAERTQQLVLHELQRRSNNLLAVVQAIAHRILAGDFSLAEAKKRFEARLLALARANRALLQSNWSEVWLRDLIQLEFEAFGRITVEGPDVSIEPQTAQNLTLLALHE